MTKPTPDTPKQALEPKDKNRYAKAVQDGRTMLTDGGSKADAARATRPVPITTHTAPLT